MTEMPDTIGVIGLGYVGLPLAVEFGKVMPVIGFDINEQRIAELRRGYDRTLEVSADELKASAHLTFSSSIDDLRKAGVFIVTVPTPVDDSKSPDLSPLK
ncbi:MAG: Vi polysaccharide biosynthesis UDP-N-acetylglucosamine C-6 dehydrogenase TviB, partial [Bacteroidota bacterium]